MKAKSTKQKSSSAGSISILAAIRLDQASSGLRVVSQSAVRKYEARARRIHAETPFSVLSGMAR